MSFKVESKNITHLYAIINQLPEQHREILFLCLCGDEINSIACKLKINKNEVRERKKNACQYLRKHAPGALSILFALGFSQE